MDTATTTESSWVTFYHDGQRYLKTARGALKRPEVFTPDIVFNLVAMGIEKVAMAILIEAGDLADNHTMVDLVRSLSRVIDLDLDLAQCLLDLGQYEDLCAFDPGHQQAVTASDLEDIVGVGEELLAASRERLEPSL